LKKTNWLAHRTLICVVALLTTLAYLPGLWGDFEFDDAPNILDNEALRISTLGWHELVNATLSGSSGPLGRPLSMLTFALNYYVAGFDPVYFKLTNVLIHLLCGVAVYFLAFQVLRVTQEPTREGAVAQAHWLAAVIASVWLVHPLNLTSVLYVVQRMTSLSAGFSFLAVGLYVLGRRKLLQGESPRGLLLVFLALVPVCVLGALSKENALLSPILMLAAELVFFRFATSNPAIGKRLAMAAAILAMLALVGLALNADRIASYVTSGYLFREFTLSERLLTQPRVLLFYLQLMAIPSTSQMGIHHDDFVLSTGMFDPPATAIAILVLAAAIVAAVLVRRRLPVLAFGILWYLVGHSMEASFIALEMVHEHRNYLPGYGPIFASIYYLLRPENQLFTERLKKPVAIAIIGILACVTFVRSLQWSEIVSHAATEVRNHPDSLRANYQMGRLYFKLFGNEPRVNFYSESERYFRHAMTLSRISVFSHVGLIQLAYKARVEPDPQWTADMIARLKTVDWEPNMVAVNGLVICQVQHYCRLPDADIVSILEAALKNPNGRPKTLGSANSMLGNYYALKMADLRKAQEYMLAAILTEPLRHEYRMDYVGMLMAANKLDDAERQLDEARRIDRYGIHRKQIEAETERIAFIRKQLEAVK
jgi:protein O-mannosyl-transferase